MGVFVHVVMLLCMLTLPQDMILNTLKNISAPVIIIYPLATLLLSVIIYNGIQNKKTSEQLEKLNITFENIVEHAPIGIAISEGQNVLFVNNEYEKILERTKSQILSMRWESYTYPDDLTKDLELLEKMQAGIIKRIFNDKTIHHARQFFEMGSNDRSCIGY